VPVPGFLRIATIAVSLVVAAGAGWAAWRGRAPRVADAVGLGVVELLALTMIGVAVTKLVNGGRAHEMTTFVGYLIAFAIIPAAGYALARMEPTRYGSVIVAVAALVEAILVVRLQQVWTGV
jgi:hypothetical protein